MDKVQIEALLQDLGLSKTEAVVYLALLKRGQSTAYRISKDTNIYKANTYQAIEGLVKKNLVTKAILNNKQVVKSVDPEEFLGILDRQKEKMQAVLPFIERNYSEDIETISVHTGIDAFMNLLYRLLDLKQDIYAFDIPSYVPDIVRLHINHYHKERIKRKVKMYHIYDYDAKSRIDYLRKIKYTYARQSKYQRSSVVSTILCGNITLIINWKKNIKVVQINDPDVAGEYKNQFFTLWDESIQ